MKLFIEVFDICGDYILSKNLSFGCGIYDIDAIQRFLAQLSDKVDSKDGFSLDGEPSKRFTITLEYDTNGEYVIKETRDKIIPGKDQILSDVVSYFRIEPEEIYLKSRKTKYVKPQQFASLLLWVIGGMTVKDAGGLFGKDHSTCLYSIRKAIPGYYVSGDTEVVGATEFFSLKYGVDLKSFIVDQYKKGTRLRDFEKVSDN